MSKQVAKEEFHSYRGLTLREDLEESPSLAVLTPLGLAMRKPVPTHFQTLKYHIENRLHGDDMRYQVSGRDMTSSTEVKPTKVRFENTSESIDTVVGFDSASPHGDRACDEQSYPSTPSITPSNPASDSTEIANHIDKIQTELDIARAQRLIAEEDVREHYA